MIDNDALIRARHAIIIAHLGVALSLLWEIETTVKGCLKEGDPADLSETYHMLASAGLRGTLGVGIAELITFNLGLTMFSVATSMLSVVSHVLGSTIIFTSVNSCQFEWFWITFLTTSLLPAAVDALYSLRGVLRKFG